MTDDHHLLPNGYMLQEFVIKSQLGEGGFGVTYLAFDESFETDVVLKEYLPTGFAIRKSGSTVVPATEKSKDDFVWGLTRFQDEARTLAKFKHENIVTVKRVFPANGTAYMAMEYLGGGSLADKLQDNRLSEDQFRPILDQIISGLKLVHEHQFLHRDIAPDNIMFTDQDVPVLIDFGAARMAMGSKSKPLSAIVKEGYAPIEQYNEKSPQGPYTDIYALSAVCYQVITGNRPVEATVRFDASNDPVQPLAGTVTGWSQNFLRAVDLGLSLKRQDRPQSLDEWLAIMNGDVPAANDHDEKLIQMIKNAWADGVITSDERQNLYIAGEALGRDPLWMDDQIQALKPAESAKDKKPKKAAGFLKLLAAAAVIAAAGFGYQWYETQEAVKQADRAAYQTAETNNSEASYQKYIKDHPDGLFKDQAQNKLVALIKTRRAREAAQAARKAKEQADTKAYTQAKDQNTERAYQAYLRNYPDGRYRTEAQSAYDKLVGRRQDGTAWQNATKANTIKGYQDYLRIYPQGQYASRARTALRRLQDRAAWNRAQNGNSLASYRRYMQGYPSGAYYAQAKSAYDRLNKTALVNKERTAWQSARKTDTAAAYLKYISDYPKGQNIPQAYHEVGYDYEKGEGGVTQNYNTAFSRYLTAANKGYSSSMNQLGVLYYYGRGVSKNYYSAVRWFRKGAGKNNSSSLYWMGHVYHYGQGVTKNLDTALDYYKRAKQRGAKTEKRIKDLQKSLGKEWYDKARNYRYGYNNTTVNYGTAMGYYKKAAGYGHALSHTAIGYMYEKGYGVSANKSTALDWYRKGAKLGEQTSEYNIGIYYNNGWVVAKNYYTAFTWVKKSADRGKKNAQRLLASYYELGRGTSKNLREAFRWYKKAADQGQARAMYKVGIFYKNGWGGVRQNKALSEQWIAKAKKAGYKP